MSFIKFLILFLFLIFGHISNAQTSQKTIYLKNGDILKGTLIEEAEEYIKIEILGGSVFNISKAKIIKIETTFPVKPKRKRRIRIEKRSYHILNAGFSTAITRQNGILHGSSFQYIFGYEFNNLDLGLGLSLDFQDGGNYYKPFIPIFIEGKRSLEKYFPSYFYSVQLGYSINQSLYFHPKIGHKFSNNEKINFNVELGYLLQQVGYIGLKTWSNADPSIHRMYNYNRLVIRLSVHLRNKPKTSE